MACTIIKQSYLRGGVCKAKGGLAAVYLALADDANLEFQFDGDDKNITTIARPAGSPVVLARVDNAVGIGNATEEVETDDTASTIGWNQEININIKALSADIIDTINDVSKTSMCALVHYASGITRVFGMEDYVEMTSGGSDSGEAGTDGNTGSIVLSGQEDRMSLPLLNSTVSAPLGDMEEGVDYVFVDDL